MRQRGFSLIELLIYVGLTAIVIGLFGGILITILRIQTQQTASRQVITESNFIMNTIKRRIWDSTSLAVTTTTLTVTTGSSSTDPTVFSITDGVIYMQEASGTAYSISTDKVRATNLVFTNLVSGATQAVQIVLSLQYNTTNPAQATTHTLESTAAPLKKTN